MTEKKSKKAKINGEEKNSERSIFHTYLKEINKIPLLSKDEEVKIAKLAAQGNKAARDRLANANLRFVIMIAKKYQGKGLALEDLVSEGNLGMLTALKNFDADKGCRFITYAVWWIRQAIVKAIHDKGRIIRLPCNRSKELARIEKTRLTLQNETNSKNDPEIPEIAALLNMSTEKTAELMHMGQNIISLDDSAFRNEDIDVTMKDCIEDNVSESPIDHAMNCALKDDLDKALDDLEKRDADIIRCHYGLGDTGKMTLKEIGERYNLTRERVRQIETRALRQLKHSSASKSLQNYTA